MLDELLHGRPYGVVAIVLNKNIKYTAINVECYSRRISTISCAFQKLYILFISGYMPYDERHYSDKYN